MQGAHQQTFVVDPWTDTGNSLARMLPIGASSHLLKDTLTHANEPIGWNAVQRNARRGDPGEPLVSGARRLHPPSGRGHLFPAAPRPARCAQDRTDYSRGNGPHRRAGSADARGAATRTVGGVWARPGPRARIAPVRRPHRPRHGSGDEPRGSGGSSLQERGSELQAAAFHGLSDTDEIPRRAAFPRRVDPRARIHHERRILVSSHAGRSRAILRKVSVGLSSHLRARRPARNGGGEIRHGHDGRQRGARVHAAM